MKPASLLFLVCVCAVGQTLEKTRVVTFDRSDAEHCKAVIIEGRAMREVVHGGTSVAVGEPVGTADGYFRVFVLVRHAGPGKAEVKPRQFSAVYSDAAHTRFAFYDKAAEVNQRRREAARAEEGVGGEDLPTSPRLPGYSGPPQSAGSTKPAKLGRLRKPDPNEVAGREDAATQESESATPVGTTVTPEQLYLLRSTLRPGNSVEGFVYFKKPRRSKVHVGLRDPLHEIDIPVEGVVFRFN